MLIESKRRIRSLIPALVCLAATPLAAAPDTPRQAQIAELQTLVGKVVDLQALETKEKSDWQARKDEMTALLELHRKELSLLNEELEKAGASAGGFDEQRRNLQNEIDALTKARRLAANAAATHRERALKLVTLFPEPLRQEVEADRLSLENWKPGEEARVALRSILSIVSAAEQFNRGVRRSTEERDGREVEVIYLGLARAYYVGSGNTAGIGEPGPAGWTWREAPDIAGAVRKAIAQLEKQSAPELVVLPVRLAKGGAR